MESLITSNCMLILVVTSCLFVVLSTYLIFKKRQLCFLKNLVIKNCMISLIYKTEAKIEEKKIFEFVTYFFSLSEELKFRIDLKDDGEYILLNKDDESEIPITSEIIESFQDFLKTQESTER